MIPEPVEEFANDKDIDISGMESEGIEWMIVLNQGSIQAKITHFNDEDGVETMMEIEDFDDETDITGHIVPDTYVYQSIQKAPVLSGKGKMLRFDVNTAAGGTFDLALGVDDDDDLMLAFMGEGG